MREALKEARKGFEAGEVPVGAVVVFENRIIGRGYNQVELLQDPTAHAEMIAITAATNALQTKWLEGASLYVTVEPCVMCASASKLAHLSRIVFGAEDVKEGFSGIVQNIIHPKTKVKSGVLKEECSALLVDFFKDKRRKY